LSVSLKATWTSRTTVLLRFAASLITGSGRRRRWSSEDKARILLDSFEPDANVSEVARRNGLSPQQLFAWRREARVLFEEASDTGASTEAVASHYRMTRQKPSRDVAHEAPQFVPVVMAASPSSSPSSGIEIVVGDLVVRVLGEVETSALAAVLTAVRRLS
jgi:transposase